MTNPLDAINAQIEAARQAAATVAAPTTAVTGYTPGAAPAVAELVQPGRAISLGEALSDSGLAVKEFLKVDKPGFLIGKDTKNYIDEIAVQFYLRDIVAFRGIRYGNPAKYLRSYDRLTEARSRKPWAQCIAEASAADPRCKGDYASADIPFIVVNDILATKGENAGKPLISKGERLGLTLSITNWKPFAEFIKPYENLRAAGKLPEDLLLQGTLVHVQKEKDGNTWGVATFKDFQAVADVIEADEAV